MSLCRINLMQPQGSCPDGLAEAEFDSSTQRCPGVQRAVVGALAWKAVSPQIAPWGKGGLVQSWFAGLGLEQPFTCSHGSVLWSCPDLDFELS